MEENTGDNVEKTVSDDRSTEPAPNVNKQNGAPVVFLQEESLFGSRKVHYSLYLKHDEMYFALARTIDKSAITGIQRVNGLWRVYLDNLEDKAKLVAEGLYVRGKHIPVLHTNPYRLDSESTIRIRVQNIPLSADDGQITRTFILKGIDVISCTRERLRINNKLTNVETGDRIVLVNANSLKEPLHRFVNIGKYKAKVIHRGQNKAPKVKCGKCLQSGHATDSCRNDWVCTLCKISGHKKGECPMNTKSTDDNSAADANSGDSTTSHTTHAAGHASMTFTEAAHNNSTADYSPRAPRKASRPSHKPPAPPKGQPKITAHVHATGSPTRQRSSSRVRSPTTPTELLHDQTKKHRHGDGDDSGED